MAATHETGFDETTKPIAQPGSATGETVIVSVDEAAALFGISPQAIRKRISKRQLSARKDSQGQWQVFLERETVATGETNTSETAETASQPRTKPDAQPRNLVAAAQAEQMAALVASIQAPLLDRIEEANRSLERERVARETAERERDELREKIAEREHAQEPPTASPAPPEDEEPISTTQDTLHQPSWLSVAWSKIKDII